MLRAPKPCMRLAACIAALAIAVPHAVRAEDWPQWGGRDRDNVTSERSGWDGTKWRITRKWTRADIGKGQTSPIVVSVDGTWYVFAMGWKNDDGGRDYVRCINAETGRDVWVKTYKCPQHGAYGAPDGTKYGGPHATPAYDSETGYLYTFSIQGHLNCWDANNGGAAVFARDVRRDYDIGKRVDVRHKRDYGFTCSPLILGKTVILEVGDGGDGRPTLLAFDKTSGERAWASECTDTRGTTNGPVPMGDDRLALLTDDNLVILDARSHKTLASHPWAVDFGCNIATPAVLGDSVLLTAAYNVKATHRVQIGSKGASVKWRSPTRATVCTPVIHDGRAYMVDGKLMCIALEDGALKWKDGRFGVEGTCLVAAGDGKVIVWGKNALTLYDCGDRARRLASVGAVLRDGRHPYPHVVLGGGYLLVKSGSGHLACYAVDQGVQAGGE